MSQKYENLKNDPTRWKKHLEYNSEYCRKWRKKNPEKVKEYNKMYRKLSKQPIGEML